MTAKIRTDRDARIRSVLTQRDTYVQNMVAMDTEAVAAWDTGKASLDKEWDVLKGAVGHVED